MKLTLVTETFPPEINAVAMTFGHISPGSSVSTALIAASEQLVTVARLRTRLAAVARVTLESQSWAQVIARFEADLLGIITHHRTP